MRKLPENWITNNFIDFEYKKYMLLSYIKTIDKFYDRKYIFPFIDDLKVHYNDSNTILNSINIIDLNNKEISSICASSIEYKIKHKKDDFLIECENIINYSLPLFDKYITKGNSIKDFVIKDINLNFFEISNTNETEGYLVVNRKIESYLYKYTSNDLSFIKKTNKKISELKTELEAEENKIINLISIDSLLPLNYCLIPCIKYKLFNIFRT